MKKQFSNVKAFACMSIFLISSAFMAITADAQYLDNLTDTWSKVPTAAYSTRKVMSSYSGPAMRLRRSSDNVETDVYFDGNGWVSLASNVGSAGSGTMLVDWVGVYSAYVTKWYDQSGNGNHATPIQCSGTITSTISSAVVSGTGSDFSNELAVNTVLYDAADGTAIGSVKTLTSATSVTLNANAAKAITGGKFFTRESQPRFINGGVIDAMPNGRPALYLNEVQTGVSTSGLTTPMVLSADANVNVFSVAKRTQVNTGNAVAIVLGNWTNFNTASANNFSVGYWSATGLATRSSITTSLATVLNQPYATRFYINAKKTTAANENTGIVQLDASGSTTSSAVVTGSTVFNNTSKLNLFKPVSFAPRALMGYCPEVIYYASTTTDAVYDATDATTLLSAQKTNYMDAVVSTPTTIQVGASKTYTTIQAAYNSIPSLISQPYIIELQSDYNASSETFPITMGYVRGVSVSNTITIRPATGVTKTISGSSTTQIIKLNGAKYVVFDGRAGGVGSAKSLTIENTSTDAGASTIWMANNATGDKVQYCTVLGSSTSTTSAPSSGTIVIGSTTETVAGYGSNTVDNCDIANASAGLPTVGVYLVGTTGFTNEGNVVSNNNIYNYFNSGAYKSSGIYVDALAQSSTITANKLYQTATRSYTAAGLHYPIYIGATTTSVSDNTIGYSSSSATGTMTIDGAFAHKCVAINISKAVTTLQGNTISDIDYTSTSAGGTYDGVLTGIYYSDGNFPTAIQSKPITIKNLKLRFSNATTLGIVGLSYFAYNGSANISYINVNNLQAIPTGDNVNTIAGTVVGIYSVGPYGGSNKFNTVYNLSCGVVGSTVAHSVTGISANTGSNQALTSERNLVYNLNAISTGASIITGINCSAGTGVGTFKNNIVALGNDVSNGAEIRGIYKASIGKDLFYHNSVYIGGAASGTTANTYAYYRNAATPSASGEVMANNIFVNQRSGGSTGSHYALKMLNAADYDGGFISSTYNLLKVGSDARNKLAFIGADVADYTTFTSSKPNFATGCTNADPNFVDPTNATPNLRIMGNTSTVNAVGADLSASVTDDYFGSTRSGLTPHDLGAYAYTPNGVAGPTVVITSATSADPTGNPLIAITITFSASVTGFTASDITLSNATLSDFAGSGAVYTANLTATTQGTVTADIASAIAADASSNGNSAASQFSRVYDIVTAVSKPIASASVYSSANSINISASAGQKVAIYSVAGQLVKSISLTSNKVTLPMAKGFYTVVVDGRQTKVLVK